MTSVPVLLVQATPRLAVALEQVLSDDGFAVVASYEDYLDACSVSGGIPEPELILLLESVAGAPQTEAIEFLRLSYPEAQLVVIGHAADKVALSAYVQAGASGRLSLAMTKSALLRALRVILYGGRLFVSGDGRRILPEAKADRRQSLRRQTYMTCEIDMGKGRPQVPGRIFEMSHAGAKVRVEAYVRLPAEFDLNFRGGLNRRCQVVRRSDGCFCVAFTDGLGGRGAVDRPTTYMGV